MDDAKILRHVDHTLLAASASAAEIEKLCGEAVKYNTASVCIPPCYAKYARALYPELNIGVVIGFPLGYDTIYAKSSAIQTAFNDTADEFDMVINITDV